MNRVLMVIDNANVCAQLNREHKIDWSAFVALANSLGRLQLAYFYDGIRPEVAASSAYQGFISILARMGITYKPIPWKEDAPYHAN